MTDEDNPKKDNAELSVSISYKVKNGSVKVSEVDLNRLGVGIVDEVIITPIGKEEGITEMLFSDSKIKSGNIIMSLSDARGLDVDNGDRVTVIKAPE